MKNHIARRIYCCSHRGLRKFGLSSAPSSHPIHHLPIPASPNPESYLLFDSFKKCPIVHCFPSITLVRHVHAGSCIEQACKESTDDESSGEVEPIDAWEEEDEAEPEIGDGGDGGGVVLHNCPWGQRALSIALELLQDFGEGIELYAFKTSPRGYIYVRIDKFSNRYGCPSMEEIEIFSRKYKKKLDEAGARGEVPKDLALEVSSPSAERLLKVPDDILRFKGLPMVVRYVEDKDEEKEGVYVVDSVETESAWCIWKVADVRENRDPSSKGRPLSRKQKDSRLKLSYDMIKQVTLYITR